MHIDNDLRLLFNKIYEGNITLFLGAGINKGSLNSEGDDAPLGNDLAQLIAKHFFPGQSDIPKDLKRVCEYVILKENRRRLDKFIYDTLNDYEPSRVIKQIPLFKWKYIYTTNFDRLVEKAYEVTSKRKQILQPMYNSRNILEYQIGRDVPYYKLHGCITQIASADIPMILTSEDYALYKMGRERLFSRLVDSLFDNTILFIGYSLSDENFRSLFSEVQQNMGGIQNFPRAYALMHNPDRIDVELWEARKVTVIESTAAQFFDALSKQAPANNDDEVNSSKISINGNNAQIDFTVAEELFKCFDRISNAVGYDNTPNFGDFYKGNKPTWEIIRANGDAQRTLYDEIIDNVLFVEEAERSHLFEVIVITAEAGGGKTSLLMRLAYDYANIFDGFCLFHKSFKNVNPLVLEEVYRVIKKRIFIFIDDAADNIKTITNVAKALRISKVPCTIICAERQNEWNAVKSQLPVLAVEYALSILDDQEIDNIIKVLAQNNYLCELHDKTQEERHRVFKEKAHKQMLVAMREATEGRDFDLIIQDEYDNIPHDLARKTYLYICALHRFGVPVRIGLLKRLSGVSFADFHEKLFEPLEKVVTEEYDDNLDIYTYRSRHPHIAEIVCRYALTRDNITNTYLEILDKMDLGYASDLSSFRELIRSTEIVASMASIEHRRVFYKRALIISNGDAIVYQHFGLMEMRNEQLDEAENLISMACQIEPKNPVYRHSYAVLLSAKAQSASNPVQSEKLFNKAQEILSDLMRWYPTNEYAYAKYAENLLQLANDTEDLLKNEYLQEAHQITLKGLRVCFDKAYLYGVQAKIYQALGQHTEQKDALYASHNSDPTSVKTALLLGWLLFRNQEYEAANNVVVETLKYSPQDERLNYLAARITETISPQNHAQIIGFLRRAFDIEYIDADANFRLGVQYFKAEDYNLAEEIFSGFKSRLIYSRNKSGDAYKVRGFLTDNQGNRIRYMGKVDTIYGNKHGYITPDVIPTNVFFRVKNNVVYTPGMRVGFEIGFNYFGAIAENVEKST